MRDLHFPIDNERRIFVSIDVLGKDTLELRNELLQIFSGKIGIGFDTAVALHDVDSILEQIAIKIHNDVGEHLDEAAVRVPRETGIFSLLDETVDRLIVKTKVQNRVHHARHGHRSAGTNGDEQRILCIADLLTDAVLKILTIFLDGIENTFWPSVIRVGVFHTRLTRNSKTGRHRKANVRHFCKVRTFATEDRLHVGVTLSNIVTLCIFTEGIDAFNLVSHHFLLKTNTNPSPPALVLRMSTFIIPQNLLRGFFNCAIIGANDDASEFSHQITCRSELFADCFVF